jgi:hypothetical protein
LSLLLFSFTCWASLRLYLFKAAKAKEVTEIAGKHELGLKTGRNNINELEFHGFFCMTSYLSSIIALNLSDPAFPK